MFGRTYLQRAAVLAFVGCLTVAALPTTTAADEPSNGALDPAGDVYPTAWATTLPGAVEHAGLYDLVRYEVTHESRDHFVLAVNVADLPDDWVLQPAPPGGHPVPATRVSAEGHDFEFNPSLAQDVVNQSVYFSISGQRFVAVVNLVELDLKNSNAFPQAQSTQYLHAMLLRAEAELVAAKDDLKTTAPLKDVLTADVHAAVDQQIDAADAKLAQAGASIGTSCANAPDAQSSGACRAQIAEAFQAARDSLQEAKATLHENAPATLDSQIEEVLGPAIETLSTTEAVFELVPAAAFDGDGAPPGWPDAAAPDPDNLPQAPSGPAIPNATILHSFHLFRIDGMGAEEKRVELQRPEGLVDLKDDLVQMTIRKADVGAAKDAKLTQFRAEASFRDVRVDYAPDAVAGNPNPLDAPGALLAQQVVTPAYGLDYTFAYEAASEPGAIPIVPIQLSVVGPAQVEIDAGGSATYYVTLKNIGATPLTGFFSLSTPGHGWRSDVSAPAWTLGAGSSQVFNVVVAGLPGAASEELTRLTANVDGGDSTSTSFHTLMKAPPEQVASEGPGASGGQKVAKKGRMPGFEGVAVLAALAGLVALGRRRFD